MKQLDLDALVSDVDKQIIVCCGSGGVGKTTLAAALALRAAERGRRTVVLTIDPARRLAQALGVHELDNTPRQLPDVGARGGELHAMMLDMKSTFDDLVLAYAAPERASDILTNPFYRSLSSSLAGTQEYMAMERLGQLHAAGEWDLIVVDTPPSRSALDFLDAPHRMARFLDSRLARLLLAPARSSGRGVLRALSVSLTVVRKVMSKVVGARILADASAFATAAQALFGGFSERAERTYAVLSAPLTSFVVIAAPHADSVAEASFLAARLRRDAMPLAGFIVNRVSPANGGDLTIERSNSAAEAIAGRYPGVAAALRVHASGLAEAAYERRLVGKLAGDHPGVPVALVAHKAANVGDVASLRRLLRGRVTL